VLIQHWIKDDERVSNYDESCFTPCNGCMLHTTNKDSCSFWTPINLTIVLQRTVKQDANSCQLCFQLMNIPLLLLLIIILALGIYPLCLLYY
jgi:hypothetical protein